MTTTRRDAEAASSAAGAHSSPQALAAPFSVETWRGWRHHSRPERVLAIRALITQHSCSEIARQLGTTKNAVVATCKRNRVAIPARSGITASEVGKQRQAEVKREQVERLTVELRAGCSLAIAAARLGITRDRARNILRDAHIRVSDLQAGLPRIKRLAKPSARKVEDKRKANPKLTAGQQQQVDAMKARMWAASSRLRALPPPDEAEAARLIAEHIARRGVTVCPPAVIPETPMNGGVWWR